jgi:hypothetical protein
MYGVHNLHTVNVWAMRNPHATCHLLFQQNFCVNVCTEIVDTNVIGPHVIQDPQEEAYTTPISLKRYLKFYWRMCLYLCVKACGFSTMVPHTTLHIECVTDLTTILRKDRLNMKVRSRGFRILPIWPPSLDFYLWGCLKEKVHAMEVWDYDSLITSTEVDAACRQQESI